jgi:meiotically up-regulated gene 157 (Mug157) protein
MEKLTSDRATAEAILALCQLIQLRNCYNGDWVPDWTDPTQDKFIIEICKNEIECSCVAISNAVLYFKTEYLRDEFMRNFRTLIEKLKPLYGIKEGGEE